MSRVCSMESKATLPVLVRRAGMRGAKTEFRRSWEGKDSWHVREKSAWFAYLLKETPRSLVLSSDQSNMGKLQHQRQHRNSTGYLYLSGPITPQKKVPSQPQPETSFCPTNLPRNTSFSNAYLIFDMHYAYYKVNTHIHQIYPSSSTRTVHLVPPNSLKRHSRISSAVVLSPRCGMGCDVGCGISQQQ